MPNVARRQILANLQASLTAMPQLDPETIFKQAVAQAGFKDKPFYTPEETALVARALMESAQASLATATAELRSDIATRETNEADTSTDQAPPA